VIGRVVKAHAAMNIRRRPSVVVAPTIHTVLHNTVVLLCHNRVITCYMRSLPCVIHCLAAHTCYSHIHGGRTLVRRWRCSPMLIIS
jgi:hypothetical protein